MFLRRSRGLAFLLTGLVGFWLSGCSADPADEQAEPEPEPELPRAEVVTPDPGPRSGGTLRVGLVLDPVSIDPRFVVDDEGELIVDALFDPLVHLDEDGEPVPAAAEDLEVDDQGRRFTFHLREARFHDGSPVTAEDFKRTFDRIADGTAEPRSFLAYLVEDIVGADTALREGGPLPGVTAVDERTLEIELDEPQPGYLATLADPSLVPTPSVAEEDPEGYAQEPIGNGAFAMAGPRE
ncbi:MAG: ABC transporter substrate-binding protein, partial [Nitriliruptoraceae bacterium]